MNDTSRKQGWAICGGALLLALLFLAGILQESYWAIALPVAMLVFFVLGLVAWVGHTIATVQVEPEAVDAPPATAPPAVTPSSRNQDAAGEVAEAGADRSP